MRLCNPAHRDCPADIVEDLSRVVSFLGESASLERELEYSENAKCGMLHIFTALEKDMDDLRDMLILPPPRRTQEPTA